MFFAAPSGALTLAFVLLSVRHSLCATLDEWRTRTIYQVMTDRFAAPEDSPDYPMVAGGVPGCQSVLGGWCGGTWQGILQNLDYIQGMNFDAIWMSPIVAQIPQYTEDGSSYAGYWQQDLYSINSDYGTAEDLQELIQAIHDRDMFFMMDVVPNHMAYSGNRSNIDYTIFNPFNDEKYYHPYCPMDYSGKNVTALEECWLGSFYVPLADLRTEDQEVQDMFGTWIKEMVSNYSVDGLRMDAGANVDPDFFTDFVKSAGVFGTAEVYLENDTTACQWQETAGSILNYPVYWPLTAGFQPDGDLSGLVSVMESEKSNCQDTTALVTFSENQDVPRFANHSDDLSLARNVATFVLLSDGIPVIYQGQEQHFTGGTNPYTNREPLWQTGSGMNVFAPMYQQIATLNTLRRQIFQNDDKFTTSQTSVIVQEDGTMAMRKGSNGKQVITVLTNAGEDSSDFTQSISNHGYTSGTQLTDVLSCSKYTVDSSGDLTVTITEGLPQVLYPTTLLKDSSICGTGGDRYASSVTATVTATTYTTTFGGQAEVTAVTATMPVSAAITTPGAGGQKYASGATARMAPGRDIFTTAIMAGIALVVGVGLAS